MSYVLLGLLYMTLAAVSVSSDSIFDNLGLPDVQAIKVRLEEGRADLLLLQNDLEVLMEKVAGMERDNEHRPHDQSHENEVRADLLLLQTDLKVLMEKVAGMERENENRPHDQSQENEGRADLILLQTDLKVLMEKVAGMERENENRPHAQSHENGIGALYVRWGRKSCEGQGTQLVYEGYAGGSYFGHKGGAVNTLCLPRDPIYNKTQPGIQGSGGDGRGLVYGVEYEFRSGHSIDAKYNELKDQEMPCAVCRAPRSTVLMVPGRNICYDGWTQEYRGYLIAGYYAYNAATKYECMDENPETVSDQVTFTNHGARFYFVESRCGSLPCPPYVQGNELTCAVCTL